VKKTPVLITFFNRPDTLRKVLRASAHRTDLEFYLASDGARDRQDKIDIEACWSVVEEELGEITQSRVLQRNTNLGCKLAMKGNLDWFFGQVKYGIILEDDCLPSDDFFNKVSSSLYSFQTNRDLISISGSDHVPDSMVSNTELFRLSMFPMVWGWGSWEDKWEKYTVEIPDIQEITKKASNEIFGSSRGIDKYLFRKVIGYRFNEVNLGKIDTWDYSLTATAWRNSLKTLQINGNLVINVGFGGKATHTLGNKPHWVANEYSQINTKSDLAKIYEGSLDRWLARNTFSCTFGEYIKNQVKRAI